MNASVEVEPDAAVLVVTAPNGRRLQWDYATDVSPSVWNSIGELPRAHEEVHNWVFEQGHMDHEYHCSDEGCDERRVIPCFC
jgi:hypothetical protein